MLLTVDVGNSHIGLVCWWAAAPALQTFAEPRQAADAVLAECARARTAGENPPEVVGIAVSEPRWAAFAAVVAASGLACRRLAGLPLPVVAASLAQTAGIDRLVAASAALPGPAVVVDAGTAVTVDVVDAAGVFQGGFIAPGPAAALAGLLRAAPALPPLRGTPQPVRPGRETSSALGAGVWGLAVGGVDRLVDACRESLPPGPLCLWATGGWGPAWAAASRHVAICVEPLLVHRGLRTWSACSS